MISTAWLNQRRPHWRRLEDLVERAERRGVRELTRSELREIGLLYRQVATDLATTREDRGSQLIADELNRALARAHNTIYAAERPRVAVIIRFFLDTVPAAFRANIWHCVVAFLVFCAAACVGAVLTYQDPDFTAKILGPAMTDTIHRREMWTHSIVAIKPLASSAIMTNNLSVAFTTFAAGISGGVGTLYFLAFNGLLIGVVGMACALAGMSMSLWSFVAPHGVLELPAIFIAGGAGLRLGQGLLFPGLLPRRDAVARAGADAVRLVLGCIPLLIVAGIVEAFVSPTDLPVAVKFSVAAALFALLVMYLSRGRHRSAADAG